MRAPVIVCLLAASLAAAEPEDPTRVSDLAFVSLSGGVNQATVTSLTDVGGVERRGIVAPWTWRAGYAVGLWPAEWVGLEVSTEVMDLGLGPDWSGLGVQVGPSVRFALPLRYVAPYVGVGATLFAPFLSARREGAEWAGSPGPLFVPRLFAGANIYFSRDLRFFLDAQVFTVDVAAQLQGPGDAQAAQRYTGLLVPSMTLGVAYTPDFFKASPSKGSLVALALLPAIGAALAGGILAGLAAK